MEDSILFTQWDANTLHHEHPAFAVDDSYCRNEAAFPSLQALREASLAAEMIHELTSDARLANGWRSGGDGDIVADGSNIPPPVAMDHDVRPPSPNSARRPPSRIMSGADQLPTSWNFSSEGTPELVYGSGSPPTKRAGVKIAGSMPAPYAQDHVMAERKRREKINQRFIELSTVIPGLKKMDKATILSDATRYVKELQEKLKDLEAGGGGNSRSMETVVLAKRPSLHEAAVLDDDGYSLSGTTVAANKLPEIEAWLSEKSVMVMIHCENGKGVARKVLAEVEVLHLSIIHANVLPFQACTLIITVTAKVEEGFTVAAEEITARLNSALLH
ncbi:hypothetical protein ACP70R_029252 [Stipagrostis hirtigluma subsp. patula]